MNPLGRPWIRAAAAVLIGAATACRNAPEARPAVELFEWERGIGLRTLAAEPASMFLWFYEWRLFDALEPGQITRAEFDWPREVSADGRTARIAAPMLTLEARVVDSAVELTLEVRNETERAWPEEAAIIACFNPGPPETKPYELGYQRKTYLVGEEGLQRFEDREMHFRADLKPALKQLSPELEFEFSANRWRTSELDSHAGLLLRESYTGRWTTGVAWEDWVGVQANNPWLCLHVATRVGPLAPGAVKTIRGRLVLIEGGREQVWERLRAPWPND